MRPRPNPAAALLAGPAYGGYQYAYPHKTAYRPLARPVPLAEAWAEEPKDALFLYAHVPFCAMRCGFCNLFTLTRGEGQVRPYLDALRRQAEAVAASLGPVRVARMALGGGTPTFLAPAELDRLLRDLRDTLGADPARAPTSVETAPGTTTPERLAVLRAHGVERISIGVESFRDDEARALGRPQARDTVEAALRAIRDAGFPVLNLDLIYGAAGQTPESFSESVAAALAWAPEEIFLYPLYVRPLTGLGRRGAPPEDDRAWDARRLAIYRAARDRLRAAGYGQVSMRMFRRGAGHDRGPAYDCARDGMVGLGAGARSYTAGLHYSTAYAVGQPGVAAIVADYVARDAARHGRADYGARLDDEDRRRRFVLMHLLQAAGLSLRAYADAFGTPLLDDLPDLAGLPEAGLATLESGILALTEAGLERSDAIGPWLQAAGVRERMRAYALR
ncbi:oxygen-independent coproporphyrinogen-3 oxidase [Methylobacterium sp. ap11]|uniref:STM4012 family radical SAM protein n=1 Tax=Methylobacterium sp. ap11 TaxID=1761799 RepID=UPI0008B58D36|nr:STM4012 family radical SAM protein [Methylobacterium sp. ap11]SEO56160.1 oxygen-independent coproporphyrinogen-3 oxidase [Methylobacterium sp. ap11]